jgi:putative hydrolase of the HAD superfamily
MKPKTIFFDVYQTLLSVNYSGNNEAWNVFSEFLKTYGIQINAEKFRETINLENQKYYKGVKDVEMKYRHHSLLKSIKVVFLSYGIKIEKEELIDLIWEFRKKHSSNLEIYPGVERMLKKLSKKHVLSIASYTQSSYTYKELEKFKIAQYFSHFIFSSDIGYRKTDQEFFRKCLEKTKSKSSECVMVGDNYLQDVVIPKQVGLKAILIENPLVNSKNTNKDVKPDSIVKLEDISKLPLIIESF